jgi:hypothetical protein
VRDGFGRGAAVGPRAGEEEEKKAARAGPCGKEKGEKGEREGRPWAGPQGEKREGEKGKEKWADPNRNRRGKIKVFQMLLNLILKFEFK